MDIDTTVAMDQRMVLDQQKNERFDIQNMMLRRSLEEEAAVTEMNSHMNGIVLDRMYDALGEHPESHANMLSEVYAEMEKYLHLDTGDFNNRLNHLYGAVTTGSRKEVDDLMLGVSAAGKGSKQDRTTKRTGMMGGLVDSYTTSIREIDTAIKDLHEKMMRDEEALAQNIRTTSENMGIGDIDEETIQTEERRMTENWKAMRKENEEELDRLRKDRKTLVTDKNRLIDELQYETSEAGSRPFQGSTRNIDEMLASPLQRHNMLDGPMASIIDVVARHNEYSGRNDPRLGDLIQNPDQLVSFIAECQSYARSSAGWSDGEGSEDSWAAAILAKIGTSGDFEGIRAAIEKMAEARVGEVLNKMSEQQEEERRRQEEQQRQQTGGVEGTGTTAPPEAMAVPASDNFPEGMTKPVLFQALQARTPAGTPVRGGADAVAAFEKGRRPASDSDGHRAQTVAIQTSLAINGLTDEQIGEVLDLYESLPVETSLADMLEDKLNQMGRIDLLKIVTSTGIDRERRERAMEELEPIAEKLAVSLGMNPDEAQNALRGIIDVGERKRRKGYVGRLEPGRGTGPSYGLSPPKP